MVRMRPPVFWLSAPFFACCRRASSRVSLSHTVVQKIRTIELDGKTIKLQIVGLFFSHGAESHDSFELSCSLADRLAPLKCCVAHVRFLLFL
jgi:hypothetical protein